jgi:hypothetical protein
MIDSCFAKLVNRPVVYGIEYFTNSKYSVLGGKCMYFSHTHPANDMHN